MFLLLFLHPISMKVSYYSNITYLSRAISKQWKGTWRSVWYDFLVVRLDQNVENNVVYYTYKVRNKVNNKHILPLRTTRKTAL